jgi:hypothetical protein
MKWIGQRKKQAPSILKYASVILYITKKCENVAKMGKVCGEQFVSQMKTREEMTASGV